MIISEEYEMSDLTATNCGCGCGNECSNGISLCTLLILLAVCGGCGNGFMGGNGGCGNDCCLLLILLLCCGGNNGSLFGNNGCGC